MATGEIWKADGSVQEVKPLDGKTFKLKELQEIVGDLLKCKH